MTQAQAGLSPQMTMGSIQDLYPYPSIERGYREPSQEREMNLMKGMENDTNKWWYLLIGVALGYFFGRKRGRDEY